MTTETWRPAMSREQVAALLTTLTALDPRLATRDAETSTLRVSGWFHIIGEVDYAYAMEFIRRAYSVPRDYPLQAAEILQGWREQQAEVRAAARVPEEEPAETLDGGAARPSVAAWLRATLDALANGEPRPPIPLGGPFLRSPEAEERTRRCTYHDLCACSHTECRDGFLDVETSRTTAAGLRTVAVERCPHCRDALLMAEDRGIAKKPRHAAGRRR